MSHFHISDAKAIKSQPGKASRAKTSDIGIINKI